MLISWALPCRALVSTNVPLDHWSYDAVEKLADYGFIESAMLASRPITRVEMARHISIAMDSLEKDENAPEILAALITRLKHEFQDELALIGALDTWHPESFVKPVEDPYLKYLHADSAPQLENVRGDHFDAGSNYRTGFATRGTFSGRAAFYLHPEYAAGSSPDEGDVDLIEGYGKVALGRYEIQAGKDSLWWGPGRHGATLLTNNAQPLRMVKVTTPQPTPLPWIFKYFGLCRSTWFLGELDSDRDIPEAKLTGVRINVKPHPRLELGLSRVIMFGGRGVPRVDAFDYVKMFRLAGEQEETNQIAGFDVSYLWPMPSEWPLRSVKLYADFSGEDEAGWLPAKWGYVFGANASDLLRTGRTDLRVEYAETHEVFYQHSLYTSGYIYKGDVIGHHVGTDARDVFVQMSHYLTEDLLVDVAFDRQTYNLSADTQPTLNIYEGGLTWFASRDWQLRAGYRYEDADAGADDNHIVQLQLIREF